MEPESSLPYSQVPATSPFSRGSIWPCEYFLTWGFTGRLCYHLAQPQSWRTTPCRLSATVYSIYLQIPSISQAVPPSATWGRAMPWWQGPPYLMGFQLQCFQNTMNTGRRSWRIPPIKGEPAKTFIINMKDWLSVAGRFGLCLKGLICTIDK